MSNAIYEQDTPTSAVAITTSDTVANKFSAIYVGGAGNVKMTTREGNVTTFNAVPVGTRIEVATNLVWATGTTATNLVGIG